MRKKRAKDLRRFTQQVVTAGNIRPDQAARFYKRMKEAWNQHQLVKRGKTL